MLFGKKSLREVNFEDVQKVVLDLKEPESVLLDYKGGVDPSKSNEDIAKDISSFANHFGGYLIYGVDAPTGSPTGFSSLNCDPAVLRDKIIKVCASPQWINPPLFIEDPHIVEGQNNGRPVKIVIVKIEESPAAPHHFKAGTTFYMRAGDTNQPVEGDPGTYAMLLNRRQKMEDIRKARWNDAQDFATRWLWQTYHPHNKEEEGLSDGIPRFSICLLPRFFNMTSIEWDAVAHALREAANQLIKKFSWSSNSYDNFCESEFQQSYASTVVYRQNEVPPQYKAAKPNVEWTCANRAGMLFHFEDMPYQLEGPTPDFKAKKPQFAFAPTIFLRRIMGFLFFAKEFYALCQRHFAFDLIVECSHTKNMLLAYYDRVNEERHVMENHFLIGRNLTTYDLMDEFIQKIIISDLDFELLRCINWPRNHTFDGPEIQSIMKPFLQKAGAER
ncbi:MAG TPA: ATP-binding protein [Candidatus Omnitrophota bacterium]|nr:ATP-binding protein [Candidatus Omnitrophota bacterium]